MACADCGVRDSHICCSRERCEPAWLLPVLLSGCLSWALHVLSCGAVQASYLADHRLKRCPKLPLRLLWRHSCSFAVRQRCLHCTGYAASNTARNLWLSHGVLHILYSSYLPWLAAMTVR